MSSNRRVETLVMSETRSWSRRSDSEIKYRNIIKSIYYKHHRLVLSIKQFIDRKLIYVNN